MKAVKLKSFLIVIQSFFTTWALMKAGRMEPGNLLTLAFFLLIFLFYNYEDKCLQQYEFDRKKFIYKISGFTAVLFTILYMAVDSPKYIETLTSPLFRLGILIAVFLGFVLMYVVLATLFFISVSRNHDTRQYRTI